MSSCPSCQSPVAPGSPSCPRCGFLLAQAPATAPPASAFTEIQRGDAVRFVTRGGFVPGIALGLVALLLVGMTALLWFLDAHGAWIAPLAIAVFLGGIGALVFISSAEITIDRDTIRVRIVSVPGQRSGDLYPRASVADVAWTKTPARHGYVYSLALVMRDGASFALPFATMGEGEASYMVGRVRAALNG